MKMKNLLAVASGRPLEEVKKNWSSSLLQVKGMGKSTDEGGHFSAVSLSLHYTDTPTYYWVSFGELAGAMATLGPHVAPSLFAAMVDNLNSVHSAPYFVLHLAFHSLFFLL